jgi:hypothetical protein
VSKLFVIRCIEIYFHACESTFKDSQEALEPKSDAYKTEAVTLAIMPL